MADRDQQPGWAFGPDEWQLDDFDRHRGRAALAEIRETLRNCRPPAPRVTKVELPEWLEDDIAAPAAH